MYNDILQLLRNELVIPTKDFGAIGCALVLDKSSHVKAKIFACEIGSECVDSAGLAAIGKKGMLGAAKFLSEEPSRGQRHPALDLLVGIVIKMNNDVQKLSKICGTNLSDKGRKMLEERLKNHAIPARTEVLDSEPTVTPSIASELPRLSLRQTSPTPKYVVSKPTTSEGVVSDLFVFSSKQSFESNDSFPLGTADDKPAQIAQSSSSAAASLRARLMKIREKGVTAAIPTSQPLENSSRALGSHESSREKPRQIEHIHSHITYFRDLLQKQPPINEDDASIANAISSLRIFHNVLAAKDGSISKHDSSGFRHEIIEHANTSIDLVRR
jgi:hypothetical protein